MKNKTWKTILAVFFSAMLIYGIYLCIEPEIEHWKRDIDISKALKEWKNTVSIKIDADNADDNETAIMEHQELWSAMQAYNEEIHKNGQSELVDAWSYQSEVFDLTAFGVEDDIFGYIAVPAIDVELPLYLGASYQNLSKGFAQLSQTSMPIGGNNTNCVVACHRGYNGSKFLRDADQLKVGDIVTLQNFWETLTYRICEKPKVIEPHEVEEILIQPNRDLLTIVTCTPYGVGSHRLIIYCERIQTP